MSSTIEASRHAAPETAPASRDERLTIVTAADERYWRCLYQFLRSAERLKLEGLHRIVAYDLGIEAGTRHRLASRFLWCEFRRFRFDQYPPHIGTTLSGCAWKPFVIQDALSSCSTGPLLWLDSATLFRRPLAEVIAEIRRTGLYSLRGQTPLGLHCDPEILDALAVPPDARRRPERSAGVLGIDPRHAAARTLVATWCAHHLVPQHVRPVSATHKSDQALLSITLFVLEASGDLSLGDEEIDISSASPIRWMTSRNKVPPWMPAWLDPLVRAYYGTYKLLDRINLTWRRRHLTRHSVRPAAMRE